jgi:hypothetical protein
MSTTAQDTCLSVSRLADVLTALGDALARPDLDGLLAAEPLLDELSRALSRAQASPADRAALLPLLGESRLALRRAELLGEGLLTVAHASAYAAGLSRGYGREGRSARTTALTAFDAKG